MGSNRGRGGSVAWFGWCPCCLCNAKDCLGGLHLPLDEAIIPTDYMGNDMMLSIFCFCLNLVRCSETKGVHFQ